MLDVVEPAVLAREICPGDPLDLGIVRAVQILNEAGIPTFESCEGGEGHASPVPVVRFYGSPGMGWKALAACLDHGLPVGELARCWDMDDGEPSGPYWKIVFSRKVS
jgi:hypothetical protein